MSDRAVDFKSNFSTYITEGRQLYNKKMYIKAIESYSKALILKPEDNNCRIARAKCYLKMGDPENTLRDAEDSLKGDSDFFKGLYLKAEALYTMGDFEFALVFYHRAHKLRPELQELRLGIQKAQEAIENAVGSPSSVKLENKGDLSFFYKGEEMKQRWPVSTSPPVRKELTQQKQKKTKTDNTTKQLLGELYNDREYLEKLLKDEGMVKAKTPRGEKLQDLIVNCINYLDTRTEFWQQQKPMYSRERDRKLMQQKWNRNRQHTPSDPSQFVLQSLDEIDSGLSSGNARVSLKKARDIMKTVHGWSEEVIPNKNEVLGSLHSLVGNALIDLGDMDKALDHHRKDLEIATQCELPDAMSRALDNIGRVYARIGKFTEAIEVWEQKIPLACGTLEKTWLFHEIGRCYLNLKNHQEARAYGLRSLEAADEIGDEEWQLNASVLVAQSELKLRNFHISVQFFEKALNRAEALKNTSAVDAINEAIRSARRQSMETELTSSKASTTEDKVKNLTLRD